MAFADVWNAVRGVTGNPREQAALLYACGAESNCESIQNLGGAPAYGPWQIYLPYHPGVTVAQANDPVFAAGYMYRVRNVVGCTATQGSLWLTDPHKAELQAARCIEGATSAEPYGASQQTQGQRYADIALQGSTTVATPTSTTQLGLQLPGFPEVPSSVTDLIPGVKGLGSIAGAIGGVAGLFGKAFDALASPDFWISILLVMAGLFIAFNGFNLVVRGSTAGKAATAAAVAA